MKYEIRLIGPGDSTTSGTLEMSRDDAQALFDADARTLEAGETIELSNADTGEILQRESR